MPQMNPMHAVTRRYTRYLPTMHRALRQRFPAALWSGNPGRPEVALTFDDGPTRRDTPRLLDLLARRGVKATFFNCGTNLHQTPHLARDIAASGHDVALHGYYHRPFLDHRSGLLRHELDELRVMIGEQTRRDPDELRYVRPPYGLFTPQSLTALNRWGYRPVMWSVVPFHWVQTEQQALDDVRAHVAPGAIIVLHEGMKTGPDVVSLTDGVIGLARDLGYQFVTVESMWHALGGGVVAD